MTRRDAFNEVYEHGLWTASGEGPSGEGSYGEFADHYVETVRQFAQEHKLNSILDLGTGDFNIGQRIAPLVKRYIAADVSDVIIARNRAAFGHLENVKFVQLDACVDVLPRVDLVLVRQVLQHLTNDEVEAVLARIDDSGCRYAIIVEHQPAVGVSAVPNAELPAHGPYLRTMLGSGIFIDQPPFARPAESLATCTYRSGECLRYYLLSYEAESPGAAS